MRKIKAEDVIVGEYFVFPHKLSVILRHIDSRIKDFENLNKRINELEKRQEETRNQLNYFRSEKDRLETENRKIKDIISQGLGINFDEWEYKTETKLVKKTSMTASEAVKAGKK